MIVRSIECNACRWIMVGVSAATDAKTRANAKREGWTRDKLTGADYCPECGLVRAHAAAERDVG